MRRSASELTAHLGGELIGPDVGIVTSVERAHLQYLGDLDRVGRAKGELVAALPASGVEVLNVDDSRVRDMASLSACPVLGDGVGPTTSAPTTSRSTGICVHGFACRRRGGRPRCGWRCTACTRSLTRWLRRRSRVARLEDVVHAYGKAEGAPSLVAGAAPVEPCCR